MRKGIKFVLHSIRFPDLIGAEEDEFRVVTVTEIKKDVPCMWSDKKDYTGWRAIDQAGKEYSCNWFSFPSDSPTPCWRWCVVDDKIWYDVTYVNSVPKKPKFLKGLSFIQYCKKHKNLFYKRSYFGCSDCYFKRPEHSQKTEKEETFKGWL